ncbi:6,7-dimethyl-8-ribityllumazine synthase [Candidatus Parcubacteria bacterium]|nr:MAG: 6,7-dimethyl-8-ribityllumazine synthase [Candidatus Parcubacteria bacterium]
MQRHEKERDVKLCNVAGFRVGIVASRFNREVTNALLREASKELAARGVKGANITLLRVNGSVEIPLALQLLAKKKRYHALVALGAIIKGETPHFEYVSKIVSEGILRVTLDYGMPVGFGILTTFNEFQAKKRVHVGADAVRAALELACHKKTVGR